MKNTNKTNKYQGLTFIDPAYDVEYTPEQVASMLECYKRIGMYMPDMTLDSYIELAGLRAWDNMRRCWID